jgi:hypothetical protein
MEAFDCPLHAQRGLNGALDHLTYLARRLERAIDRRAYLEKASPGHSPTLLAPGVGVEGPKSTALRLPSTPSTVRASDWARWGARAAPVSTES